MSGAKARNFDAIIIGGGAAGLMCAMTAGARGRRVLLLEHAEKVGKKILISGGGRCNFTNIDCSAENFISGNRHFCKSALARYTQHDFLALVEKHGIAWHEKTLGQLFCDGSARQIVAMLCAECDAAGVDMRTGHRITGVSRDGDYTVTTDQGDFRAPALVLASGGLSIPKMGATGFSHDVARKFGLPLRDVRPGLVPLSLSPGDLDMMRPLSGVSLECVASVGKRSFREAMLLTHRGLSGPAILQISSYWGEGDEIALDIAPNRSAAAFLCDLKRGRPKIETKTALSEILPTRLAAAFASDAVPRKPIGEIADQALRDLGARLNDWRVQPTGTLGYAKAEVTLGGVDTNALSSRSMEAKEIPGLYVIGEAVDVTGWLGGYNFQWAWSSGHAAGCTL